jgi:predicted transcriptional regulator
MKKIQKSYQFILVLKNVDENTPNLEDSLYEAGCDDALINFRNGTVYLDFDRKAASLEEAVMSAIKNVESSSVKAIVANVAPEDLVTESEVAKRLDVKRQAVSLWIKGARRKSFPRPVMRLSDKSPFWKWTEVVEWLYANKLIHEEEEVVNAFFLETMNAVLEERDENIRKSRQGLLKKFEKFHISGEYKEIHRGH